MLTPKQFRAPPKQCVYCGRPAGSTRDHVPPKSLFLQPLPLQLITVPACERCNSGFSALDVAFKEWLGFSLGVASHQSARYWNEKLLPTVRDNRRRQREINSSIRPASGTVRASPVGMYELHIDASIQDRMAARLVRGLWYKERKQILPADIPISQMLLSDFEDYHDLVGRLRWKHFDNQFSYALALVPEYEWTALWCFLFHGGNATMAFTGKAIYLAR